MTVSLLLNADYTPFKILQTKREAWGLIEDEVVYGVNGEGTATQIKSPSQTFEIPSVLVLKHYVNAPKRNVVWSRGGVMRRDGYRCIYCNRTVGDQDVRGRLLQHKDFTIEHIIPRSKGGKNTWGNTACACGPCNRRKADRTPTEAGMRLLWEPKRPRAGHTLVVSGDVPREWRKYLQTA